jgi:predicted nucleic acid-binding protein
VLQELFHVRRRRADVGNAIHAARTAARAVAETLPVTGEDLLFACATLEDHPQISVRDAIHVAVMKAASIHTIISTDTDFDAIREIRRIDPKDAV